MGVGEHEEEGLQWRLGRGEREQVDAGADQVGDERRELLLRARDGEAAVGVALDLQAGVPLPGDVDGPRVVARAQQVPGVGRLRPELGDRSSG